MEPVRLSGFVLDAFQLSAGRLVVTVFTRQSGVQRAIWRVGQKGPRAYVGALNHISFQLSGKEHQALRNMKEVGLDRHHYELASRYHGLAALHHWAALIKRSQPDGQDDDRVYRLLDHVLPKGAVDRRELLCRTLYLETWLLHFCGVLPKGAPGDTDLSEESRLVAAVPRPLITAVFGQKIDTFLPEMRDTEFPDLTTEPLGKLWTHFIGSQLKTRGTLLEQLQERR